MAKVFEIRFFSIFKTNPSIDYDIVQHEYHVNVHYCYYFNYYYYFYMLFLCFHVAKWLLYSGKKEVFTANRTLCLLRSKVFACCALSSPLLLYFALSVC